MFVLSYSDYLEAQALREPLRSSVRTNKQIRAATARVLARLGFHRMRVSDVCKEAKVAQGTFYLHFTDKEVAVRVVLDEFVTMMLGARPNAPVETDYEYLFNIVDWYGEVFRANAGLFKSLIQLGGEDAACRETWDRWNKSLALAITADLKARGAFKALDDELIRLTLYVSGGMVDQALFAIYAFHRSPDFEAVLRKPSHLAETVAILWYRSLLGANPPLDKLSDRGRAIVALGDPHRAAS